jgi:hypothetical protein
MLRELFFKEMESLASRFKKKGQEPLTIMIIPHGQERIFSMHLTWLMIFFLAGILLLAIFLGGYAIYLQNKKSEEIQRLRDLYGANFGATLSLHKNSREIMERNDSLFANLISIGEITGIPPSDMGIFSDSDEYESRAEKQLLSEILGSIRYRPGFDYIPTIYEIRALRNALQERSTLVITLQSIVGRGGIGLYSDMPIGRPLNMNGSLTDTSDFGVRPDPVSKTGIEFHNGFDTSGPAGTPVYATASGVVQKVLHNDPGYGNAIIIQHKFGYYSLYGHLQSVYIRPGMNVYKGLQIGGMGRTGRVTGTHLHYEIWLGSQNRINPLPLMCSIDFSTGVCKNFHKSI